MQDTGALYMGINQLFDRMRKKLGIGGRNLEAAGEFLPDTGDLAERIAEASQSLTSHGMRIDLRADFPEIQNGSKGAELIKTLKAELKKRGTSLKEVGRIHLAYPHKNPDLFPGHYDSALGVVQNVRMLLEKSAPDVQWIQLDNLVESVRLGRSEDQTSVHALTARQVYEVYPSNPDAPVPFVTQENGKKEFFLVVDTGAEQGTTYANLLSFIEQSGGEVLAAVANYNYGSHLRQVRPHDDEKLRAEAELKPEFNDPARNTGRLAQLALAFAKSAKSTGQNWTPAESIEMFEEKLNKVGNSVFALTDGEAERIIKTVDGSYYRPSSFVEILGGLDKKAAEFEAEEQKPQGLPRVQAVQVKKRSGAPTV